MIRSGFSALWEDRLRSSTLHQTGSVLGDDTQHCWCTYDVEPRHLGPVLRPEMTLSAISRRLAESSFVPG
jgi:hypothetical protein